LAVGAVLGPQEQCLAGSWKDPGTAYINISLRNYIARQCRGAHLCGVYQQAALLSAGGRPAAAAAAGGRQNLRACHATRCLGDCVRFVLLNRGVQDSQACSPSLFYKCMWRCAVGQTVAGHVRHCVSPHYRVLAVGGRKGGQLHHGRYLCTARRLPKSKLAPSGHPCIAHCWIALGWRLLSLGCRSGASFNHQPVELVFMALLLPGRALVLQQGPSKQPASALAPRSRPRVLTAARRPQQAAATRRSVVMSASECVRGALAAVVPPSCTPAWHALDNASGCGQQPFACPLSLLNTPPSTPALLPASPACPPRLPPQPRMHQS
jgi:hypothetical protein